MLKFVCLASSTAHTSRGMVCNDTRQEQGNTTNAVQSFVGRLWFDAIVGKQHMCGELQWFGWVRWGKSTFKCATVPGTLSNLSCFDQ
jgi:hypothetical protein